MEVLRQARITTIGLHKRKRSKGLRRFLFVLLTTLGMDSLQPPGSKNFRRKESAESVERVEEVCAVLDASSDASTPVACSVAKNTALASHISMEEILMLRELLSRDSVEDSVKNALLKQVIDQKIEGALKAERQRSTQERDTLAAQQLQRLNQLQEKCEAERKKTSAAIFQVSEDRRARTLQEAEAHRALASETAKLVHMQSSVKIEVEEQKKKCEEFKESAAAARRELHETKESLAAATVSQRLLRAYKAEKQRCQTDLDETFRAFSAPAWQAQQTMEELEKSTKSTLLSLKSLQAALAGFRKRRIHSPPTRNATTDTVGALPCTKRSREPQPSPQENAAAPINRPAANLQASSRHGQPGLRSAPGGEEQGRSGLLGAPPTIAEAIVGQESASEARGRESEAAPGSSTTTQKTLPLPTIPKKAKTDKTEVIHIDITSPQTSLTGRPSSEWVLK